MLLRDAQFHERIGRAALLRIGGVEVDELLRTDRAAVRAMPIQRLEQQRAEQKVQQRLWRVGILGEVQRLRSAAVRECARCVR